MRNRILFYSSVKSISLFQTQKFYVTDINLLKENGFLVETTNKISQFFLFNKYDIAFIYFYRYGFFAALIAKLFAKKIYFTGGIDDLDKDYSTTTRYKIQKLFFKLCYAFSDECLVVSNADLENIKRIYRNKNLTKLYISYHCIEVDKFLCKNINEKKNIFTTIAWMEGVENPIRKGVDVSLKVFSLLVKKYDEFKDSKFMIIGKKGLGTDYLIRLCEEFGIVDRVEFTGEIEDEKKVELLKQSSYYMQLSKYEGFGIAALEALACQNIVINSGRGGLKDSIGEFGIKVDIDQELESMADEIYRKIQAIDMDFLKKGEKYVIENFSYEKRKEDFKKIIK